MAAKIRLKLSEVISSRYVNAEGQTKIYLKKRINAVPKEIFGFIKGRFEIEIGPAPAYTRFLVLIPDAP